MFRAISLCLLGALLLGAADAPQKSAFDKPTLEAYVRHLYLLHPQLTVTIADPKPSALPGFQGSPRAIAQGAQSQEVSLYVSKDGKKIVQGTFYDVTTNPFKPELDKLKTQFQPALGTAGAPVAIVRVQRFAVPLLQGRSRDAAQEPDPELSHTGAPLLQGLSRWKACTRGPRPPPWPAAASSSRNPTPSGTFTTGSSRTRMRITADNLKDQVLGWAKDNKDRGRLQLGACMDNKATQAEVEKEMEEARALDVSGTPTMFINGRRISQTIDWPNLKTIIDAEIEYQKTAKNAGDDCGCEVKLDLPGMPQTKAPAVPGTVKKK